MMLKLVKRNKKLGIIKLFYFKKENLLQKEENLLLALLGRNIEYTLSDTVCVFIANSLIIHFCIFF